MDYDMIYKNTLNADVVKLVQTSSKLKLGLFRALIDHKEADTDQVKKYLNVTNEMIARYDESLAKLVKDMDDYKYQNGVTSRGITYKKAKPYLLAKNDYASMLKFADALFTDISKGTVKTTKDADDMFEEYAEKYFDGMGDTTADALGEVGELYDAIGKLDESECKHAQSVDWPAIYRKSDRNELNKAMTKLMDWLIDGMNSGEIKFDSDDVTCPILFMTNVIEYTTFSVTVFMCRVAAIYTYAYQLLNNGNCAVACEAANSISSYKINVMNAADEMSYREPKDFPGFVSLVMEFCGAMHTSIPGCDNNQDRWWMNIPMENNKIKNELIGNRLVTMMSDVWAATRFPDLKAYQEFAKQMNRLINDTNGLGQPNDMQVMFTTIRDANSDDKKDLVANICAFAIWELHKISALLEQITSAYRESFYQTQGNTPFKHYYEQLQKVLRQLYSDSVHTFISKLKDIELDENKNRSEEVNAAFVSMSIDVPGLTNDNSSVHNMMTAVPDVLPVALEAMPVYESLRMYSEYAKTILGDDAYYSEAVDFSKIIDAFQAAITAFFNKVKRFFGNKSVAAATKWVTDNKATLNGAEYEGQMEVLPYLSDINCPSIDAVTDKLNAFTLDNVKDDEALNKFIDSMYVGINPELVKIMKSNDKNKTASIQNFIMFGVRPGVTVATKTLNTSDEIKQEMANWISNVTGCAAIAIAYANSEKKANEAMRSLKSKVASASNQMSDEHVAPTIDEGSAQPSQPAAKADSTALQNAISKIQIAYSTITFASYDIFHKVIMDEYNYIKTAYSMIKK